MKKRIARAAALWMTLALVLSLAACGSETDKGTTKAEGSGQETKAEEETKGEEKAETVSGETIKIGLMLQLSGASPADSEELLKGCQMIADIINNETDYDLSLAKTAGLPNLGGAKVEVVVGDVGTNDAAMSECERLITEEDVKAFAGIIGSSGVKVAATAFEKYGVPYVTNASSPSLTDSGYEYVVRIFPDDMLYCEGIFQMIEELNKNENAGIKTVVLCSEDSEFGANITAIEEELAEKYGLEVVQTVTYSASATNVTSEVLQLKNADADVVMMSSYTADAILFMQTFKEQNYLPKMLVGQRGGFSRNEIFETIGSGMDYVYNTSAWATDLNAPNVELITKLFSEATGGIPIQEGVLRAMTDFYTICLAMDQAGSTDADAIMEEYRNGIEIPDGQKWISVDVKVDEQGQNLENSVLILQAKDGVYRTVYPADVASEAYTYPVPGWNER
ncbi:MAG: ABC transporter substrate-binding protein [Lachnospiraceae bacterium]|nr:ABC transporter substrate-binding protein [Lachnospiraceae bacterium]